MKNDTLAALFLVLISFIYLGCNSEEPIDPEIQSRIPAQIFPPSIESFSPQSALAGEQITIIGTGFGQLPIGIQVFFGDVQAQLVSASSTRIVVVVPKGANNAPIQVKAEGGDTFSSADFALILPPNIEDFSPKSAWVGEQITLTGTGFGEKLQEVEVLFGNKEGEVISVTPNEIVVAVPEDAADGEIYVKVETGENLSTQTFMLLPDVYMAGVVSGVATVWKNNVPILQLNTSSGFEAIQVIEGDIYTVGFEIVNLLREAALFINNEKIELEQPLDILSNSATDLYVSKDEILIVGQQRTDNGTVRKPFLNNNSTYGLLSSDSNVSEALAVHKNGPKTYVVGLSGSNPTMWENGNLIILPISNNAFNGVAADITVINNKTYVVGTQRGNQFRNPVLWIDGDYNLISSENATAQSIFSSNNDIYIAGSLFRDGLNSSATNAVYWKNGVIVDLTEETNTNGDEDAYDISVYKNTVYVAGQINGQAVLWRNGAPLYLGEGEVKSVVIAEE